MDFLVYDDYMNGNPTISVIMGIYNCAPYLQEALDSLYSQTYKDFEIILCDDGSKDDTYKIAKENQKRHPEIVLLKNPRNMGLNQTLNNCLAVAKGEFIARMDGDDISLPHRFQEELEFLESHPEYDIVSGPMIYFDENGEFRRGKGGGVVTNNDFIKGTPFCHAPCMVRKAAYDEVGGYTVDTRLLRVEDYHLWFKMYATGFKGWNLSEPIYAMRDDRKAVARRNFRNKLNQAYVKYIGFKMLGLPVWTYIYCLKPILVGLLPRPIYRFLHRKF